MWMARVRCQDQKGSGFGHMSKHPGQGLWWLKLHSWKQAGPPVLPQMGPNSVLSFQSPPNDWHKALASCHPVPMRDGSAAEDLGYKSNSNCRQHQVLGLGSNMKGFPSSLILGLLRLSVLLNPFRTGPFPGTLTPSLAFPGNRVWMYQHPCNKWADLPKSWALYLQALEPQNILLSPTTLRPKGNPGWDSTQCLLNKWINILRTGCNWGSGQPPI